MKTRTQLVSGLILAFFLILAWVPSPVRAESKAIPEELEVTWQIIVSADSSWSSQTIRQKDDKVSSRYDGNESFSLTLAGTTVLTKISSDWEGNLYFKPMSDNNTYKRSCQGSGTETSWHLNELGNWTKEKGFEFKDFESTTVKNWQYRWPGTEHEEAGDNPIEWLKLILPQTENEPLRYQMCLEPFFFIAYDSVYEYFETTGTYYSYWDNWEGGGSESGQLGDHAGYNAPSLAHQAWVDRAETHPDARSVKGELTFSDGRFRDKGTIYHPFRCEQNWTNEWNHGQSFIEINYEINRKPGIKAIQPNQVLGRYIYRDKDNYDEATHFVAGKDTVIQVFLEDGLKVDKVKNLELDIYRDGEKIATLTSPKKDKTNNAMIFIPKDRAECGNWAEGIYRFVARLDDTEKTRYYVLFQERKKMRILAVPVTANYGGEIKAPGSNWANADTFLRNVYPLANEKVEYLHLPGPPIDASDRRFDVKTEDGREWLSIKLSYLQPHRFDGSPQYDAIVGFIADCIRVEKDGKIADIGGYTTLKPTCVVALDNEYQQNLAHEIAHFYGIGDEYNGGCFNLDVNPPPAGYQGTKWGTKNEPATSKAGSVQASSYGSGSLISADLHPFDVQQKRLRDDSISFMGVTARKDPALYWTSPAIWQSLYYSFKPQPGKKNLRASTTQSLNRVLVVSGLLSRSGQVEVLEPCFSYRGSEPIPSVPGSHSILALDESGTVLAQQGFDPCYVSLTNPPQELDKAVFSVEAPFPEETRSFQIVEGSQVLYEIPVSASEPSITISKPLAGESLSGLATIEWTASDEDSDDLYFKVEYSPDGNQWLVLEPATSLTQFTADFSSLPGGEQARVRVTATDGVNAVAAISPGFRVATKAPQVYIETPVEGATLVQEEGVLLTGRAYDRQEGWFYDNTRLVWTSDRDGELGRGSFLYLNNLSPGSHSISLRAENSWGQSALSTVNLTVVAGSTDTPEDLGTKTGVALDHTFTVVFNAPVDPDTVNEESITVSDATGNSVPVTITPGSDGKSALIQPPQANYLPGQSYTILVNSSVKSAAGQQLRSSYQKTFITVDAGN